MLLPRTILRTPTGQRPVLLCLLMKNLVFIFFLYFCGGDSDVIHAKPLEGGVDVFGVTFFMPWNDVLF